ncbi:MAG: PPOX class F420-dependent oxidoreductase [Chloroflexi bacterium]|nr:MAG: PPOX class F420-dependent oxidoreductase [Chloroflexota bacterium]
MNLSPELRALLEKKAFGHVITMNPDGSPQVTLVWVDVHNEKPSFNTNTARQKGRNLSRDQRVMMSVQDPDNLGNYALIEGTAQVSTDGAAAQIDHLAQKYSGAAQYRMAPGEVRISVDIDVTRVSGRGPWVA